MVIEFRDSCRPNQLIHESDNLTGRVIKFCKHEPTKVFQYLFQQSVCTHYIPKIWKTAEIVPIAKKDQPKVLNDYRPIALTSAVIASCAHQFTWPQNQ